VGENFLGSVLTGHCSLTIENPTKVPTGEVSSRAAVAHGSGHKPTRSRAENFSKVRTKAKNQLPSEIAGLALKSLTIRLCSRTVKSFFNSNHDWFYRQENYRLEK
jgi:hypothetical protein